MWLLRTCSRLAIAVVSVADRSEDGGGVVSVGERPLRPGPGHAVGGHRAAQAGRIDRVPAERDPDRERADEGVTGPGRVDGLDGWRRDLDLIATQWHEQHAPRAQGHDERHRRCRRRSARIAARSIAVVTGQRRPDRSANSVSLGTSQSVAASSPPRSARPAPG